MKKQIFRRTQWVAILAGIPLLTACYEEASTNAAPATPTNTIANAPMAAPAPQAPPAPQVPGPLPAPPPAPAPPEPVKPVEGKADPVVKKVFDPSTLNLSPGLVDIIKLAQSGVSEEVMRDYVVKSPFAYNLTADEIIYLNDIGVPSAVISGMLKKEGATAPAAAAGLASPTNATAAAAPTPPAPPAQPEAPAPVQPAPVQPAPAPPPTAAPQQSAEAATTVVQQPVYVQSAPPAQTVVTYQYFYDSLAPYGSWIYISDYGYCWQPTVAVVNTSWRPYYHNGRWLWSDWGWYWHSDYTWGWAPFHYGRWHRHHHYGWLWMPDTCWGPAWVSWRYSPSYCGWAPLPPGAHYRAGFGFTYHGSKVDLHFGFGLGYSDYAFVPYHRFHGHYAHQHGVVGQQAQTIYNETKVINNYITGDNNTIINNGVGRDYVANVTKQAIPTVMVRDLPANSAANARPDRIERQGEKQVVYRPVLPQTPSGAAPAVAPAVATLAKDGKGLPAKQTAIPGSTSVASLTAGGSDFSGASRFKLPPPQTPVANKETAPGTAGTTVRTDDASLPGKMIPVAKSTGAAEPAPRTAPAATGERKVDLGHPAAPVKTPKESVGARSYTPPSLDTGARSKIEPPATKRNESPVLTPLPNHLFQRPSAPAKESPAAPTAPISGSGGLSSSAARSAAPLAKESPALSRPSETKPMPMAPAPPSAAPTVPAAPTITPSSPKTVPAKPSYTPPSVREVTPATPSYTPPTPKVTPSAPSFNPPAVRQTAPSLPSYTPATPKTTPSVPSYTPPAVRQVAPSMPSVAPSAPSTPPARNFNVPSARQSPPAGGGSDAKRSPR